MGRLTVDADTLLLYHCDETSVPGTGYATLVDAIASGGTARNLTEINGGGNVRSPNYTHIINAGGVAGRLARWFPGKGGASAAYLQRAGDAASTAALVGSYTVRFWVRPDALASEIIAYTGPTEVAADNCLFQLTVLASGLLQLFWEQGAGVNVNVTQTTGTGLSVGVWSHVAITVDNSGGTSTVKFYANGTLQQTVSGATKATGGSNGTWSIGASTGGVSNPATTFRGALTGICVDTVVRSGVEIAGYAALTNYTHPTDGNTFAAWHCQEQPDLLEATPYGYHLRKVGSGAIEIVDPLLADGGRARHGDGTVEYIGHWGYATLISGVLADHTLELWTRLDTGYSTAQSGFATIGDWTDEAQANNALSWVLRTDRKLILSYERGSGTDVTFTSTNPIYPSLADGYSRHHVAITKYDAGGTNRTSEIYVDGALQQTMTSTTDMDGGTNDYFRLWVGDGSTYHAMLGTFDEVRLSKKRRSSAEILAAASSNLPVNTLVSPAPGTMPPGSVVVIDVTHADGASSLASVTMTAGAETIFSGVPSGGGFGSGYSSSLNSVTANGRRYTLLRTGGWSGSSLTITVTSVDVSGGTTVTSFTWSLTAHAPAWALVTPVANATISAGDGVTMDVTDIGDDLASQAITANGVLVYSGGAFAAGYTTSTRTPITHGYRYVLRAAAGWTSGVLAIYASATDAAGAPGALLVFFTVEAAAVAPNPAAVERAAPVVSGGDVRLVWRDGEIDMAISTAGDVAADEGLRTAVLLSLFTDRRAEAGDALPAGDGDLRGWWADEFSDVEGDRIGSRLWLLDRSARRGDVARRAEELAREALAWMLEDRVTDHLDVAAEVAGAELVITVTIDRPTGDPVSFRFSHVWGAEKETA